MNQFDKLFAQFQKQRENIFYEMPAKEPASLFIEEYINFMFPVNSGRNLSKSESESKYLQLQYKFKQLLLPIRDQLERSVDELTEETFSAFPSLYKQSLKDADAILKNDPAATCLEEVIIAYPGFFAIIVYRFTHELYKLNIPILPRLISEYAHSKTGIDIHPGATIGSHFFIDHGTGIVIGETTIINNHVKIYQGVTIGALSVKKELAKSKRHPTIESNVTIYAGSTILGGETTIGHNSIIGGNVWLTKSIPPHSKVYNKNNEQLAVNN